ncbi:type I methionyl aminopeptidase [Halosquirtibacter xylanolyticus]|uniref:type I methionyl aminopeptidase n=1 Tax=Halosquirtibacter xylanolyticus TaxID=3374599 RepID=UPI003749C216|nr:type I methionyl aminopeptidase [Prolixibacteraceae bacterium]
MNGSIYYKTEQEISFIRKSSLLVSKTLAEITKLIQPGISTLELDAVAECYIREQGATPSFLDYNEFPNSLCVSVNDCVLHGLPSNYLIKDGDVVSVDCGVCLDGYHGDGCFTFLVGNVSENHYNLCKSAYESLSCALENAHEGKNLGDIGYSIENIAKEADFGVVKSFGGHGIGKNLHESPFVRNFGRSKKGMKLLRGLTLAIEPMLTEYSSDVFLSDDGWSVLTKDGGVGVHFEHTLAVRPYGAETLTDFCFVENQLKKNKFLWRSSLL